MWRRSPGFPTTPAGHRVSPLNPKHFSSVTIKLRASEAIARPVQRITGFIAVCDTVSVGCSPRATPTRSATISSASRPRLQPYSINLLVFQTCVLRCVLKVTLIFSSDRYFLQFKQFRISIFEGRFLLRPNLDQTRESILYLHLPPFVIELVSLLRNHQICKLFCYHHFNNNKKDPSGHDSPDASPEREVFVTAIAP